MGVVGAAAAGARVAGATGGEGYIWLSPRESSEAPSPGSLAYTQPFQLLSQEGVSTQGAVSREQGALST